MYAPVAGRHSALPAPSPAVAACTAPVPHRSLWVHRPGRPHTPVHSASLPSRVLPVVSQPVPVKIHPCHNQTADPAPGSDHLLIRACNRPNIPDDIAILSFDPDFQTVNSNNCWLH